MAKKGYVFWVNHEIQLEIAEAFHQDILESYSEIN